MPEAFAWLALFALVVAALGSIFVLRLLWHLGSLARDLRGRGILVAPIASGATVRREGVLEAGPGPFPRPTA